MTNRAAKLAPHIVAVLLAGAALATVELNAAVAADDCLAKPAGGTAGQHWYYHLDHATKRQCWYLRDGATASNATAGSRQAAVAKRSDSPLSPSTANARAELPASDLPTGDAEKSEPTPATGSEAAISGPMNTGSSAASQSSIASRWPDQTNPALPADGLTQQQPLVAAQAAPKDNAMVLAEATPAQAADANALREAEVSTAPIVTADVEGPSRTVLLAGLAALALVGSLISVIWARIRARRQIRLEAGQPRGPRWPDDMEDQPISPPWQRPAARDLDHAREPARDGRNRPVRQPRAVADPVTAANVAPRMDLSEIEELLSHYAGQHGNG